MFLYMFDNHKLKEVVTYLKEAKIIRNQQQFVELINGNRTVVSEIITGKRLMSERFIHKVCDVFPIISVNWFLKDEGQMINREFYSMSHRNESSVRVTGIRTSDELERGCINCERLKWKNDDLLKEIMELKSENSKLLEDNAVLRYLLDGKQNTS